MTVYAIPDRVIFRVSVSCVNYFVVWVVVCKKAGQNEETWPACLNFFVFYDCCDIVSNCFQDHIVIKGYLNKKSQRTKKWKYMYFVLNGTEQQLYYFENQKVCIIIINIANLKFTTHHEYCTFYQSFICVCFYRGQSPKGW